MMNGVIFLTSLVIGIAGPGLEHGIEVDFVKRAPSVIATCSYTGSGSVKNAEVLVYSPGEGDDEYQKGGTDVNGVFAFVPDAPGQWKIVVDDGHGHRKEAAVTVTEEFFLSEETAQVPGEDAGTGKIGFTDLPLWLRAIWGLTLIFGIACLLYLLKVKKLIQSGNDRA